MQNSRHKTNPAKQNLKYYRLLSIDYRMDVVCDYYIRRSDYKLGKFILSKSPLNEAQKGIIIVDENIRTIIENIDWNKYAVRSIGRYHLSSEQIHQAFNAAVLK